MRDKLANYVHGNINSESPQSLSQVVKKGRPTVILT